MGNNECFSHERQASNLSDPLCLLALIPASVMGLPYNAHTKVCHHETMTTPSKSSKAPKLPTLSLIAAVANNGIIGIRNTLPWHLPEDLKHFKALTLGHPILMGRKTWESLGRPLPGRLNVVITRNTDYKPEGCVIAHSLEGARALAGDVETLFVIGGEELYRQALPVADRVYLTEIHEHYDGDASFPKLDPAHWQESERKAQQSASGLAFDFVTYIRKD